MVSHPRKLILIFTGVRTSNLTFSNFIISFLSVHGVIGAMHIFGRRGNHCYVGGMSYVMHQQSSCWSHTEVISH
jgi:hypothetical protein